MTRGVLGAELLGEDVRGECTSEGVEPLEEDPDDDELDVREEASDVAACKRLDVTPSMGVELKKRRFAGLLEGIAKPSSDRILRLGGLRRDDGDKVRLMSAAGSFSDPLS